MWVNEVCVVQWSSTHADSAHRLRVALEHCVDWDICHTASLSDLRCSGTLPCEGHSDLPYTHTLQTTPLIKINRHYISSCCVYVCFRLTLAAIRAIVPVTWSTLAAVRSIDPRPAGTRAVSRVTWLNQRRCCFTSTLTAASAGIKAKCPILKKKTLLPSTTETKLNTKN